MYLIPYWLSYLVILFSITSSLHIHNNTIKEVQYEQITLILAILNTIGPSTKNIHYDSTLGISPTLLL